METLEKVEVAISQRERDRANIQIREAEDRLARVAAEIVRVRLEYGPHTFGARFTVYASMSEQMMMYSHDLKGTASEVIRVLARRIEMEFATVDFARAKPARIEDGKPVYAFEGRGL